MSSLAPLYVPKTKYTNLTEINEAQTMIMKFIDLWVHREKTTVPLKEIIAEMTIQNIDKNTTIYSLKILLKKGYIRRSSEISNKTKFVQLRRV